LDHDRDPAETREWLDALDSVEAFEGIGRVDELLNGIVQAARRKGAKLPFAANTAYVNTIAPHDEPAHPGDRAIEHKIRSLIRWNAAAIVLRANKTSSELGGHIASFQSAATLYDTGFMHFWRGAVGVKKVEAELGPIDVLINNAGITKDGAFHKMTLEQWTAVINTNLGSLFNMTRQVIEGMRARKFGRVINISSINGQKGQFGQVNYSAAKAGDIGFTKALALENAKGGITVNAICPGYINTEMVQAVPKDVLEKSILPLIPVNRLGEPEEIARAVVFLAADEAGAITGSTLSINGGQYMV
jgi:acetoacetyl-CoA reductase